MTGSINQFGEVQAIGGVNEKIEGFFGLCKARGLTGNQGVIIPKANQLNLMLKEEVIAAVEQGLFSVYVVENVEQALELLCLPKGQKLEDLHDAITRKLKSLHNICEAVDEEAEEEYLQEEVKKIEHAKEIGKKI